MKVDRRTLLGGGAMIALGGITGLWTGAGRAQAAPARPKAPFQLSDADWRKRLTDGQYKVLRLADTEAPFTSPLNNEHRKGIFACAGCEQKLYASSTKFDSHTGWPSFYQPLPKAIATMPDRELGYVRTEVHCARCGGHLGHVFDDGPRPTGLRYCMNGVAMKFLPA